VILKACVEALKQAPELTEVCNRKGAVECRDTIVEAVKWGPWPFFGRIVRYEGTLRCYFDRASWPQNRYRETIGYDGFV
jgi:hypothetical protein